MEANLYVQLPRLGLLAALALAGAAARADEEAMSAEEVLPARGRAVRFRNDVVPLLTRLGCNGGGCHGKASGQNGFRLSLLGFEPEFDYESLVHESRGRRLAGHAPEQTLLVRKATARVPHGGGKRLEPGSMEYGLLVAWIAQGAPAPDETDPRLIELEIAPREVVLDHKALVSLRVVARFSDGSSRDVTALADYQANEPELVACSPAGAIRANGPPGLAAVMARFAGAVAAAQVVIPFARDAAQSAAVAQALDRLEPALAASPIDTALVRQWRRLGVAPSALADDATFLRRAMIDICGTLPTRDEVEQYLADRAPDKKARLVDRLLDRPEYASYFALKWAAILQNRGAGYSTSRQREGTALFAGWIRDALAANVPYDRFVWRILTASGSQSENPPAVWFRGLRKPGELVESVAQAFLGVRMQCAQCHHHPAERISQNDYHAMAAAFAAVGRKGGFADAEVPTSEIIYYNDAAVLLHPRTGLPVTPRMLDGTPLPADVGEDPRRGLARWITSPGNAYFARTMANRLWAHFMGRGIIDPIDDARSTNPPTNPSLLDALARQFVEAGFDVKQLIRAITGSYAYALSSTPEPLNQGDTQSFARFYPRRLVAEVLLDGISQVLDVPTEFPGGPGTFPPGTRAIDLPDENVAAHFLDVFGRPARRSACECERVDAPSLAQALELVNSPEVHRKLTSENGFAYRVANAGMPHEARVAEIFLRILGRFPTPPEARDAAAYLQAEADPAEACRNLIWSLLAANEFLFNH